MSIFSWLRQWRTRHADPKAAVQGAGGATPKRPRIPARRMSDLEAYVNAHYVYHRFPYNEEIPIPWEQRYERPAPPKPEKPRPAPKDNDVRYSLKSDGPEPPEGARFSAKQDLEYSDLDRASLRVEDFPGLERFASQERPTFVDLIHRHLTEKNAVSTEVYRAAGLDRRLFSKMMTERFYQPSRDTALAMMLALQLGPKDAEALLKSAGYSLSPSSRRDLVIQYFVENGNAGGVMVVNLALQLMHERPIGFSRLSGA